jgi:acetylglutamate kinase
MIRYGTRKNLKDVQEKAQVMSEAFPWLSKFFDKIVVVKVGGEILKDSSLAQNFAKDVVLLNASGVRVIVCHGGGPQVSERMKKVGIDPVFVNGHRATDEVTRDITTEVFLGEINKNLVSLMNSSAGRAVGLSGLDARTIQVRQKDPQLGYVGEIEFIRINLIQKLLETDYIPVLSPIGIDAKGEVYNINADVVAGELARSLDAEKLIMLTNTEGLYEDFANKASFISEIDVSNLSRLLSSGVFDKGMIPKINAIINALSGKVASAHVLDGRLEHALLLEIFTEEGVGTMVYP